MSDDYKDPLTDHNYDGIKEYDNQLPRWWVYLFVGTIIFSVFYLYYFHIGDIGNNLKESYQKEYLEEKNRLALIAQQVPEKSEEELHAALEEPGILSTGKEIYDAKCASCHSADGGGLVGPNLTDNYWIHGNSLTAIREVIANGVPEKGMVPWKGVLKPEEMDAAAVYVKTLVGQKVANPKAPQGDLMKED